MAWPKSRSLKTTTPDMHEAGASPAVRATCVANAECLAHLLQLLDRYCLQHGVDSESLHDLHLIAEEACVNVLRHAYPADKPGPLGLLVQAKARDGRTLIELTIEDEGIPFDPLSVPEPDRDGPVEDMPLGGLGVMLIRRLSDVQRYTRDPVRGNVFTLCKFLPVAGGA